MAKGKNHKQGEGAHWTDTSRDAVLVLAIRGDARTNGAVLENAAMKALHFLQIGLEAHGYQPVIPVNVFSDAEFAIIAEAYRAAYGMRSVRLGDMGGIEALPEAVSGR